MTVDQIIEEVRACARGQKNQVDISHLLHRHRCYGLLSYNKTPKELLERAVNHIAIKERYRACEPFFKRATFPYAVIKGAVLSYSVYGDPAVRVSVDMESLKSILAHSADKVGNAGAHKRGMTNV